MTLNRFAFIGAVSAAFVGLTAVSAFAQAPQFASFSGGTFSFINNTSSANFVSGNGSWSTQSVQFTFEQDALGYTKGTVVNATASLSSDADGAAVNLGTAGYDQALKNISLSFTADGKNLLTVSATGDILGKGKSAGLSSDSAAGDTISYTSDVFLFYGTNSSTGSFKIASSSTIGVGAGGFLKSFVANGTNSGVFSGYTAPVPEAGTLIGLGTMIAGGGAFALRRRRSAK